MKPLIVYSPHTEKFIQDYDFSEEFKVTHSPDDYVLTLQDHYESAIAIGGGSVIDTAKIIAKNVQVAVPTTYSGSACTSHAVVWSKQWKLSVKTGKPSVVMLRNECLAPQIILDESKFDMHSHIIESMYSRKTPRLLHGLIWSFFNEEDALKQSLLAGQAIENTGTNVIHALSYPLTTIYGISHAEAIKTIYLKMSDEVLHSEIDWKEVVCDAYKYSQFRDTILNITKKDVLRWLKV